MRITIIFSSILILSCVVGSSYQESNLKDVVQVITWFLELSLQRKGTLELFKNKSLPLNLFKDTLLAGNLGWETIRISGFEGLVVDKNNIDFYYTEPDFSICLNLSVQSDLALEMQKYDADIALFDTVPIYGNGNLKLGLKDIDFALCTNISLEEKKLTNFYIKPNFTGLVFELSGFWKNEEFSTFLTQIIQTLEGILMRFWNKEINCITCILSSFLGNLINGLLNANSPPIIDCQDSCGLSDFAFMRTIHSKNATEALVSFLEDPTIKQYALGVGDYLNSHLENQQSYF